MDPEARRGLRTVVQASVALAVVLLTFWITELLKNDVAGLREIARYSLAIVAVGTLFYGFENATRAFNFDIGGLIKGSSGDSTIEEKAKDIKKTATEIQQQVKEEAAT